MSVTFQITLKYFSVILGYYAAYNVNSLPTFRDNTSIISSKMKKPTKLLVLGFLELEDGSGRLSRNVDNVIPLCGPQYQRVSHILLTSHSKPQITHFNSLSIAVSFIVLQFNCCSIFTCIVVLNRGAYVVVRVQLRTWLETFCYVLNSVSFVWAEN